MLEGCTPFPREFAEEYIRAGYWQRQTLGDLLQQAARAREGRVFVTDRFGALTREELDRQSDWVAFRLLALGLRRGDIVLVQFPNVREFIIVFFALAKIGVVPVLCLPPHRNLELTAFAKITAAKAYFFSPEFRNFNFVAMAREIQAEAPSLQHLIAAGDGAEPGVTYLDPWLAAAPPGDIGAALSPHRPDPFDVAFLLLSGGTTGVPKLIPRTHADYICNARECARVLNWGADTAFLIALPIAHNFPLGQPGMVAALLAGGRVAISASTEPEVVFEAIERQKATFLGVSPALLIALLNAPDRTKYDLSSLRHVCAGGQKMLPELVDRTKAAWQFVSPGQAFGMAEGLTNLTRPDDPWEVIRDTQGRPVCAADEIRIVDEEDQDVARGETGELLVRGPYTIRGYYKADEHNRIAFTADGFYRTGDIVRLHPSGNLVVEGRRKDLINRGGEKISAEEVENLVLRHASVHMAAVVAMPDPILGERGCAFVIPKPGRTLTFEELTAFLLEQRIAKFKLPERLELVEAFPLTGVGKVSKKDLRAMIAAKLAEERKRAAV